MCKSICSAFQKLGQQTKYLLIALGHRAGLISQNHAECAMQTVKPCVKIDAKVNAHGNSQVLLPQRLQQYGCLAVVPYQQALSILAKLSP